ncbi:helix-turn-helix domain-containing protein [Allomesorhizobium camelthorni]|uniref:Helix-turn-helix transcriptional regulator n=1 Tax=Allomesorhizobium camelthorni TaxID=475069 RepID=A0A6G4WH67_9HYPH|nr:helix-turn-helix transcriptional regulator [Mesorhizobium camelthorni]NGO54101.1 helix-turn-helix transcriptional regulator [Mesorhizobium camelthorni]
MDIEHIVGTNVRRIRLARGLSQERLAFDAEVDRSYLGALERGEQNPTVRILARIAETLTCTVADLVTESDTPLPANLPRGIRQKG